jgi:hypothetical protein
VTRARNLDGSFDEFNASFSRALYEASSKIDFAKKVREEDKRLILNANRCDPDMSFYDRYEDELASSSDEAEEETMVIEDTHREYLPDEFKHERGGNSCLAVSYDSHDAAMAAMVRCLCHLN